MTKETIWSDRQIGCVAQIDSFDVSPFNETYKEWRRFVLRVKLQIIVARLAERLLPMPDVRGSNLVIGEIYDEHISYYLLVEETK